MNRASGLPLPQSRATPIGRKFRAAPGTRGNPGIVVLCVAANNSPDWRPSGIGRLPGPPHALALLEMGSSGPGHRCVLDLARSGEGVHQQCDWDFSSQDALRGRKRRGLRVLSSHGTSRCAWRGGVGGRLLAAGVLLPRLARGCAMDSACHWVADLLSFLQGLLTLYPAALQLPQTLSATRSLL